MSKIQLQSIADIVPPPAPPSSADNIEVIIFSMMLLIILSIIAYHYRSEKQQFKRLIRKYKNKIINQREMAFEVSRLIKKQPALTDRHAHENFNNLLQAACYSRNGIDEHTMKELIRRVEKWI